MKVLQLLLKIALVGCCISSCLEVTVSNELICIDFNQLYPEAEGFICKFPQVTEKLTVIFQDSIKDPGSLQILNSLKNNTFLSENGLHLTVLYLLHSTLVPTSREVVTINEKKTQVKYSIQDSRNTFVVLGSTAAEVEQLLQQLSTKKQPIQPLLMITGSLVNPTDIVVHFDNIKYKVFSILQAVDICFKIFHVFNLQYPLASNQVWTFIQVFFYNIRTKYDKKYSSVSKLIKELSD